MISNYDGNRPIIVTAYGFVSKDEKPLQNVNILEQIMSLFRWNHAHCDTSMKLGTVVVHDETKILSRGCHLKCCLIWY